LKFRILPKVHRFTDANGQTHLPGEIVDLPASYLGENWLQRIEPLQKPVKVTSTKIESRPQKPSQEQTSEPLSVERSEVSNLPSEVESKIREVKKRIKGRRGH
jgi:hypothetical protein